MPKRYPPYGKALPDMTIEYKFGGTSGKIRITGMQAY